MRYTYYDIAGKAPQSHDYHKFWKKIYKSHKTMQKGEKQYHYGYTVSISCLTQFYFLFK